MRNGARTRLGDFGGAHAQPADARRLCVGGRLCPGGSAPPRAAGRIAGGYGRASMWSLPRTQPAEGRKDRLPCLNGTLFRGAQLHYAVQRRRLSGDLGVRPGFGAGGACRWRSSWSASPFQEADLVPRSRCVREGDAIPRTAARHSPSRSRSRRAV